MTKFGWTAILTTGGLAVLIGLVLIFTGLTALRAMFTGINVATMLCYGYDKNLASAGRQRVPEVALHILAAAGGTPGALVGQIVFRHKTRDRRFRAVFWVIAAIQAALLTTIWCGRG